MQGTARTFLEKGLWMKLGGVNLEYIIYFPERIEFGPHFPVNRRDFFIQ
jgi:hypothetical protein